MSKTTLESWEQESDLLVDKLLTEYDENIMPLPDFDCEPHLLISKVRKHYMDYIIKLLSVNYENNQKLLNKNIYLPSAIWRCAKNIEMAAARSCMVVQLYRKNIVTVIKDLNNDTNKGKLNKQLFQCLKSPPLNEKKLQTDASTIDNCYCNLRKKRRKISTPPNVVSKLPIHLSNQTQQYTIPVIVNANVESTQCNFNNDKPMQEEPEKDMSQTNNNYPTLNSVKMSIESQDSDELMLQMEKLFQSETNDDDIFEGTLCDTINTNVIDNMKISDGTNDIQTAIQKQDSIVENHAAQIRSLDERLASLAGLLETNEIINQVTPKTKKHSSSKWLCEEYFMKQRLFETLDQIRDENRQRFIRIKSKFMELFGDDGDYENVLSPLDESPEFIISCREGIAPWVVKLLTPYYIKGRIIGKALFKSLAKHLIRLIYQCSRYPHEYEVKSFVSDFLENHKKIRCEADYMQFRIENI